MLGFECITVSFQSFLNDETRGESMIVSSRNVDLGRIRLNYIYTYPAITFFWQFFMTSISFPGYKSTGQICRVILNCSRQARYYRSVILATLL